jgi:hypothetical protein
MDLIIEPTNDKTVHTDRDGRKYTVTHNHTVNGVQIGQSIKPIKQTTQDIHLIMYQKGKVFESPQGIGISAQGYLYLLTNGTVQNGAGDSPWKFNSVEDAESFFVKWKAMQSIIFELDWKEI